MMECFSDTCGILCAAYTYNNYLTFIAADGSVHFELLEGAVQHCALSDANHGERLFAVTTGPSIKFSKLGKALEIINVGEFTSKVMRWTGVCWMQKNARFLLCSDDGFVATEAITGTIEASPKILAKGFGIVSEIGPQNRIFTAANKLSTVESLLAISANSNDVIILSASKNDVPTLIWF